jgi:catechol 2,3-dioxygenase-like lactoylglutathione lyase family enzyme
MKTVEIISVPVTDQQKSKEFYLKMGLSLVRENPFAGGQNWVELSFPGGGSNITLVTWFNKMPAGSLQGMVIACEDIEKEIARLNHNGITTGKVDDTPWGKFVSVNDPDGNSWSLHQH